MDADERPGPALPTGLVLRRDSQIPRTLAVRAAREREEQPWELPYLSRFVQLSDERDAAAWFHFCTGHHVEFLYWGATSTAAERVIGAIRAEDDREALRWAELVAALIGGSAAMLHYCAAFDPTRYDPCLRPSMAAEREDFSGDMSRDFLAMMSARARMEAELGAHGERYADATAALASADRFWRRHHGAVVMALHPGSSLLRDKLVRLEQEEEAFDPTHYVEEVVHGEQALDDYDDYFGVVRDDGLKVGDYWTQAVEKLATVHSSFTMDAPTRSALMRGDAALLAIVSEALGSAPDATGAR